MMLGPFTRLPDWRQIGSRQIRSDRLPRQIARLDPPDWRQIGFDYPVMHVYI